MQPLKARRGAATGEQEDTSVKDARLVVVEGFAYDLVISPVQLLTI